MPKTIPTTEEESAVLHKAVLRAATYLGLSLSELSGVLELNAEGIAQLKSGHKFMEADTREWKKALCVIFLYRNLDVCVAYDEEIMKQWMASKNSELNGVPQDIIKTTIGLIRVISYNEGYANRFGVYFEDTVAALDLFDLSQKDLVVAS